MQQNWGEGSPANHPKGARTLVAVDHVWKGVVAKHRISIKKCGTRLAMLIFGDSVLQLQSLHMQVLGRSALQHP